MARAFADIAFTPTVRALQRENGSADQYDRFLAAETPSGDRLGPKEVAFIEKIDGFYQATVNSEGWPYVQFRGGPEGFLKVVDDRTIAYADFRGNRQYLSDGNLVGDSRISLILMDYANRRRLKVWGHAQVIDRDEDPGLVERLHDPSYRALPERAVIIAIKALDWNCPAHIPRRLTASQMDGEITRLRDQIAGLEDQNRSLEAALGQSD